MFVHAVKFHISRSLWERSKTRAWMKRNKGMPRLPDESWYFDNAVSGSGFEPLGFSQEVRNSILKLAEAEKSRILDQLRKMVTDPPLLHAFLSSMDVDFFSPKGVYLHSKPSALVLRIDEDSFIVLSDNRKEGKLVVEKFKSCFLELGKKIEDFGYLMDKFHTGRDIIRNWLESKKDILAIRELQPKTDLEKEVARIVDQITDSHISNLEIVFKDPSESFEYDLLLVLHEKLALCIEVMDYESIKDEIQKLEKTTKHFKENLKSAILLRTFDKTNRLGIECVIVLNGFPRDVFSSIREIAISRGIVLLDAKSLNDINLIFSSKLSTLARTPVPSFDDFISEYQKRLNLSK